MNLFRSRRRDVRPRRAARPRLAWDVLEDRTLLSTLTIAQENQLTGTPESQWQISGAGDPTIQGFATDISVNVGQTVSFKINDTQKAPYHLDIYRMGYYQGDGARLVTTLSSKLTKKQAQPDPLTDPTTGLVDAGNWAVSASWTVPSNATSGIYFADVVREDTGGKSQIVFIVRNDASHSQVLFQTSDQTWQAYNDWGGNSLYFGSPAGRAYQVSYNRPFNDAADAGDDFVWNAEYPMVRWMEMNGYDVSYFTGVDADRYGSLIKNHQIYMSVGHDEYWSGNQRSNVEAALAAGVNLAFLSGNEMFWKTYLSKSIATGAQANRTLVCYKETKPGALIDPKNPNIWTGTWRDPRFSPPADGGRPENALTGTLFVVNGYQDSAITVPSTASALRFWRNTSIAKLSPGATATLPQGTLGYEWDVNADNGFQPAGEFNLSSTSLDVSPQLLLDYGNTYGTGAATHSLTEYRAPSGALVFGAGTVQWSWGLDSHHNHGPTGTSADMQQATVNLLADMGAQPATLQAGLVAATASTDHTPPKSVITSPTANTPLQATIPVTINGTASDSGGGVVAGVEVSVDGGTTWHPAQGTTSWAYIWTPAAAGSYSIRSRAVDDSGNLEKPSSGVTVTVSSATIAGPVSLWNNATTPAVANAQDSNAVEVGVKFRADVAGTITGIRFYKGPTNTGTHVADLWTSTGTLLASATFTSESASGWQQVSFATPVAIAAHTTYIASYHTNVGRYAVDNFGFETSGANYGPLHALAQNVDGPNGVYVYSAGPAFPTNSYAASNYWVDVVFDPPGATIPTVTGETPAPGASGVATNTDPTATFNEAVQPSSISWTLQDAQGNSVAGTVGYNNVTLTTTFTPPAALNNGTTYTATVGGVQDLSGNPMPVPVSWSFTTIAAGPISLWTDASTPAVTSVNDPNAVELGVKFRADVAGTITGIRFYKGAGNTGTHVGNLWTNTGTLLGSVTFTNETASGWEQASFAAPLAISANTTYVASYFAPAGYYAVDNGFFAGSGADNAPLHALADGADGADGLYSYGSVSSFPTSSYLSSNYWVDVLFVANVAGAAAPQIAGAGPAAPLTFSSLTPVDPIVLAVVPPVTEETAQGLVRTVKKNQLPTVETMEV